MKTLSAYVGLRAIGWLVHSNSEIIQHGIKRLHVPFDNYYEYMAGLPVTKRINRRMKRQMRRNLWRYKSRRDNLRHYLDKHLAKSDATYSRDEMLQLRVKALSVKLQPHELAAVIMNLQQRRGYKSQRGVSDNENSEYLQEIERHEENLKQFPSIAAYLATLPSSKNIIFNRQSYINEFNAIMDTQQLPDEIRRRIYGFIYYQNPLRKGKIAKCPYENNRDVMPGSHPLHQEFRIWRDVLNIKIWDGANNEVEIPWETKKTWVEKLMRGTHLTKAACLKDLSIKKSSMYSWLSGKQIAGHPVNGLFFKLGINSDFETLWQELYSATDTDKLRQFLKKKYAFTEIVLDELCDADFSTLGHADVSAKAAKKLLPQLQLGQKLKQAILDVYGVVDFNQVALRNVILEQHFDAYKSLVEGLQKKYPDLTKIKFELDPLLKAGNKLRKAQASGKRKDEKFVKEHADKPLGGHAGSYNAKKLRLWIESNGRSPYEPEYEIPLAELFTDKYNLDHIVPKSKLVEGGENNLVLCRTEINEAKDNAYTGIEFAEQIGVLDGYLQIMEQMPEAKQVFMKMRMQDIPTDWISRRQCSDYNTKCFASVANGLNIPNKLVHKYLSLWKLPEYTDQDARRYLACAWVLANFDQESITYFDNIQAVNGHVYSLQAALPALDIANSPISLQRIKFTRKTKFGHTPRFALHGESIHGQRTRKFRDNKGNLKVEKFYKIRQPIGKLTAPMVERIMDEALKRKVKQRIAEKGSHEDGILSLIETPVLHDGNPVKAVSVAVNAECIYPLHSTDGKGNTGPKGKYHIPCDFVFSDKNHSLTIIAMPDGKIIRETTTLMQHVDNLNGPKKRPVKALTLLERNMVLLDGTKYMVIGASESLTLRPAYTLSATDNRKVKKEDWAKLKKLHVNQFGEVIKAVTAATFLSDPKANF